MDTKQKMAIVGSSLIVIGVRMGFVGFALLVSAAFAWTTRLVEKGAGGFTAKVEGASKTVGVVEGKEAKNAGLAEIQRNRSEETSVAS